MEANFNLKSGLLDNHRPFCPQLGQLSFSNPNAELPQGCSQI